ncbi:RIP metalloprotease RseP [Streptococcus caprae]|uniref:Zinc metalloprotease n=1 Tax=Streptococcus caprae TaxID=1640501 RepID=A0ABV8CV10_9STRE
MVQIISFIIIFGVLVIVHEFGHFYFAKKAGILVREFAIGMGPKIFSHRDAEGTLYTVRILPLGGYVRMAGWGEDKTEIKTGSPATLSLNNQGLVTRINLSDKQLDQTSLPINITSYDLEDALEISGLVLEETRTYHVSHEATIVEEDGTEVRIAPLDVQYQNASIWGRIMTNFAGPMNNFILAILVFVGLAFLQGGVVNYDSNQVRVAQDGAIAQAGVQSGDKILSIDGIEVTNWSELTEAVDQSTSTLQKGGSLTVVVETADGQQKTFQVTPKESDGAYYIGVNPSLKTGFWDKILGGFEMAWAGASRILQALKNLVFKPSLNQLGGPVAMYQMIGQAASDGVYSLLYLMALLSLNLGIFNLIPIPALDGGKILMNIVEAIRRKPLKEETETYITLAGVLIMVVLMVAVTWNDIMRTFF